MNALSRAAALAVLCAAAGVGAQAPSGSPDQYLPLFTPEMIRKASPQQAARMRATEARNRAAWDQRQAEARARAEAAARPAETPPPAPQGRGSKIYKWVDKDGNVHFGDAPAGAGAEEVQVGGAARQRGRPLPPPSLTGESPPRE